MISNKQESRLTTLMKAHGKKYEALAHLECELLHLENRILSCKSRNIDTKKMELVLHNKMVIRKLMVKDTDMTFELVKQEIDKQLPINQPSQMDLI